MNRVISWLQIIRLRQILTVFLLSLTVFIGTAFDLHGHPLQAQAQASLDKPAYVDSPSARAQRVQADAEKSAELLAKEGIKVQSQATESTQKAGNNLIDTVREKLNLDEPLDPGTKQAGEQLKETVTGNKD
jgi:ABC-type transport system substrate-binding protein